VHDEASIDLPGTPRVLAKYYDDSASHGSEGDYEAQPARNAYAAVMTPPSPPPRPPGTTDGAAICVSEQVVKDDDLDKASVDQLLAAVNDRTVVLPEPSASREVCFRRFALSTRRLATDNVLVCRGCSPFLGSAFHEPRRFARSIKCSRDCAQA
jgi:hypothetical protein